MTKQKHFKRRVRERMQKSGESYTTARLHLLKNVPVAPKETLPASGAPARVRFRVRRLFGRTRTPLGLQYFAPAFCIVMSLAIGVVGFMTITTEYSPSARSIYVAEGQP